MSLAVQHVFERNAVIIAIARSMTTLSYRYTCLPNNKLTLKHMHGLN